MSLYIGKDNVNDNVLHITKNTRSMQDMKNGFEYGSTIFISNKSLFEVVYTASIAVPISTASNYGIAVLDSTLESYLSNNLYTVFIYVVDNLNNGRSAFYSGVFYFKWGSGSLTAVNTDIMNNGKTLLFIVAAPVSNSLKGEILLSKDSIKFGSIDLALKKFIAFSTTTPAGTVSYNLGQNGFMYIVDAIGSESFLFSSTAIQYKKGGMLYDFISVSASSRVHSYISLTNYGTVGTHYNSVGNGYDGDICSHHLSSIINTSYQQIHASFIYPFYYAEGWSGGGDVSSFNVNVTLSSNESKLLGFAFTPWLGFIIEWNHSTKMFYYGAFRFTNDIELNYTGLVAPILLLKSV